MSKTPVAEASKKFAKGDHPIQKILVTKENDAFTAELLAHVFPSESNLKTEASADAAEKALSLSNLETHLDQWMEEEVKAYISPENTQTGCLGPKDAKYQFDITTNCGTLIVDQDRLGLASQSNFCSIRANCCVYQGKWLYEVMLGSKGVMQIGWCTIKCKFSQEEGVGDTKDSYAYDGSRQRKWNATTQKYGDLWNTGDVITCTIDCDNGIIAFYRNGKNLGEAFNSIHLGPGYAYFPAVSLSLHETLRANFGATPVKYPVAGFSPLQIVPTTDVAKTNLLQRYLEKLLHAPKSLRMSSEETCVIGKEGIPDPLTETRSKHSSILLTISHVFNKLAPLLKKAYIVEACLLELFLKLNDFTIVKEDQPIINKLLDCMWAFLQPFELKQCIQHLMLSLLSAYRFSPSTPDFRYQKRYLTLVVAIMKHPQTRQYLLMEKEIFDQIKLPMFLHIKPLDDIGLEQMAPTVWWPVDPEEESEAPHSSNKDREAYLGSCEKLRARIEEVEAIQIELMKVLLCHTDFTDKKTTRLLFIERFRRFLKDNMTTNINMWPLPVSLCMFHRMIHALRYYWDEFKTESDRFVLSTEAYMPIQEFWSDQRDYYDFPRCGGSMSHLNRIHAAEVNKAQGFKLGKDGQITPLDDSDTAGSDYPKTEMPSGNSLMEILDGIMLLYHVAAHKQLGKMNSLRDSMQEYVQSLTDTDKKLEACPKEMSDVKEELLRARAVFLEKIVQLSRQMCWIRAVVYSKQKQEDVAWLLKVALKTVDKASKFKLLFQYMPEFYLEIVMHSYNALKNYFHPTVPFQSLPQYSELVREFAMFLVRHFTDNRILLTDTRDNIIQALACFTCYERSLKVLENLPEKDCDHLIRALVAPYESRSWAQTNWILVRIWKGCGFGFRYSHLPHLVPSRVQLTDFGSASLQKPCPSPKFQTLLADVLDKNPEVATRFLDTLLTQLNWSFSEFIGMMQEIQTVINRTERRVLLESRQLKICGTCFEISVCLFRVIEMIVNIISDLFTDWTRPSAELLMQRLLQVICLVLNRITLKGGMFDNVVSMFITGLESVTHYPMLAVVAGILSALVLKSGVHCEQLTCQILLSDPGFQVATLEFMLGGNPDEPPKTTKKEGFRDKHFDFRNYSEVSAEEVECLKKLIRHIKEREKTFVRQCVEIKDEMVCKICYANPLNTVFRPCGHQSCRSCISHQMLIKKECFFCKTPIEKLDSIDI